MKTKMTIRNGWAMVAVRQARRTGLTAIMAVIMLVVLPEVTAAPGDLDPSFGSGGRVITDLDGGDEVRALAIQANGQIVAAGHTYVGYNKIDFALARYNVDGTLDSTFGIAGRVTTDFGGNEYAYAVVCQPDGKVVVAGHTAANTIDLALARYNSDGILDSTFGTNGLVIADSWSYVLALALRADGKLMVAGVSRSDFALARYNSDGTLDSTFGTNGLVTTDFGGYDAAYALTIQPDGKLVAAGYTYSSGNSDFALARYNPDGTLDQAFGENGLVTTNFGSFDNGLALALQLDGKLIMGGVSGYGSDFLLARYNPDGTLDTTFGNVGRVSTSFGGYSFDYDLALQTDGKLVVAGSVRLSPGEQNTSNFAIIRYDSNGTLDTGFGSGGRVTTDFSEGFNRGDAQANAVLIQADGKIVAAGTSRGNFALARYTGTPTPTPYGGTPRTIPGLIQAEDYDIGGQAVSYNDITPGNEEGVYRQDDVDIKQSTDEGGGYAVGWFAAGEWLGYTVDVEQTGTYDIEVRVGSALPGRTFHIEVGGVDVTGLISVPQMDDWDRYETVRVSGVSLTAGRQRVRVVMNDLDFMDLNWISFALGNSESAARSTSVTHLIR